MRTKILTSDTNIKFKIRNKKPKIAFAPLLRSRRGKLSRLALEHLLQQCYVFILFRAESKWKLSIEHWLNWATARIIFISYVTLMAYSCNWLAEAIKYSTEPVCGTDDGECWVFERYGVDPCALLCVRKFTIGSTLIKINIDYPFNFVPKFIAVFGSTCFSSSACRRANTEDVASEQSEKGWSNFENCGGINLPRLESIFIKFEET